MTDENVGTESPASVFASLHRGKLALCKAADCLILEGRVAFDKQFSVSDGPVNARTSEHYRKATKAYTE